MDEYRLWQEDYRREVEEVLASMKKGGHAPAASSTAPSPMQAIPPAGVMHELADARGELAKIVPLLDDLRRQLAAREAELQRELRRRARFKELAVRLNTAVRRLDEELSAARRRLREEGLRSKDLALRLRASLQSRRRSAADLVLEQRKILQWTSDARVLQGRINELEMGFDAKSQALSALAARADAAARAYEERAAEREALISDLTAKLELERAERARLQERLDCERSVSVQVARGAEAETSRLAEERDAVFRRLDQTLADLKAEKAARERERRELEGAKAEMNRLQEEISIERDKANSGTHVVEAERDAFRIELDKAAAESARLRGEAAAARQAKAAAEEARAKSLQLEEEAKKREVKVREREGLAAEAVEKAAAAQREAEALKQRVAADIEAAKARLTADARSQAQAARKQEEERAALEAERQKLRELWESERRASAQRLRNSEQKAADRSRIAEESAAALEKAGRVLSGDFTYAAPAPAPESQAKPEPKKDSPPEGLWKKLTRKFRN